MRGRSRRSCPGTPCAAGTAAGSYRGSGGSSKIEKTTFIPPVKLSC